MHCQREASAVSSTRTPASLAARSPAWPIGERVARSGPFVMNTAAELRQAESDYRRGLLGRISS